MNGALSCQYWNKILIALGNCESFSSQLHFMWRKCQSYLSITHSNDIRNSIYTFIFKLFNEFEEHNDFEYIAPCLIYWCILNWFWMETSTLVACLCCQVMARTDTFRATSLFVLMHSGIVHVYQLLCLNHIRELQLYFYFTHYCPFPLLLFMCLSLWQSFSWVPL